MANTLVFLKNAFEELKQENNKNKSFVFILLVLLSIPLTYTVNSICIAIFVIATIISIRKSNFKIDIVLLLPILLYLLMAISFFWSIDIENTIPSLSKELSLLLIPICFFVFGGLAKNQKSVLLKYYSHGIFIYCIFYLLKAFFRFFISHDSSVFFYHELVTKDVNAIHVSVYVAIAFFYFFTKEIKKLFDFAAMIILFIMVFLLTSKNIIIVFIGLMIVYQLFYTKTAKRMRLRNLVLFVLFIGSLAFVGKIKERFQQEYETIMTDSTVNDVISKGNDKVYNVSIKQAWTNKTFQQNDYFPGTAFRVYQFRVFLELFNEDHIFFSGYGLNASYPKINKKGIEHNIYLGDGKNYGYQTLNFHNQYLQNFADLGVFGFLILLVLVSVNLRNALKSKNFVHISFAVMMISLFLTESFLWRQRGVVFFTLMFCIFNSREYFFSWSNNKITERTFN